MELAELRQQLEEMQAMLEAGREDENGGWDQAALEAEFRRRLVVMFTLRTKPNLACGNKFVVLSELP